MLKVPVHKSETPAQRRKQELQQIRDRAAKLFQSGVRGGQIAAMLSEAQDQFLVRVVEETLAGFSAVEREQISKHAAMIAIGGSGRGEVAPFSDLDLLFVYRPQIWELMGRFSKRIVPECWDAGIKLGQRVHTIEEAIRQALGDPHLSSALVHTRCLWGDETLAQRLARRFYRRVIRRRLGSFIDDCVNGRQEERNQCGATGQQLEPDVKRSLGGLRDVHLMYWIGFAHYETIDIESMRLKDVLSQDDAHRLSGAVEFLTKVRIDLHLHANRANDLLTKDEQLRIATSRNIERVDGQTPVERFMQEYFSHVSAIADISERFVARHRPRSLASRIRRSLLANRVNGHFLLTASELDVRSGHAYRVCRSLDEIMRVYYAAALYRVALSPRLRDKIKQKAQTLAPGPSAEASRLFLEILGATGRLSQTLRSMHDTNVLELLIPEWKRVRCLIQFNQYHHFTVDEHTLKCLEICEGFAQEDTSLGAVYRDVKPKALLHLALLLHDAGKGREEDHCEVGRRLALDVCQRLRMPASHAEVVSFLVRRHLEMADLAFRHDISDPRIQLEFSHLFRTPENLSLLYVLTAADVSGVGPGVWNHWKADLLGEFYNRLNYILSGQHPRFQEAERLRQIREHVYRSIVPLDGSSAADNLRHWVDEQLNDFSPQYLTTTPPPQIAADLNIIRGLKPGEIRVDGHYDANSQTVDYRVILDELHASGCFHMIAGVLTAKHIDILGAEITTSRDNIVVDVFHVVDQDYVGEVPEERIREVGNAVRDVLLRKTTVEQLFRRHKRFVTLGVKEPVMHLPTRVVIDNDTSDRCTVVSVFAHDRPGLLYTISRALFQLDLSVDLAKIATHFDQVADVFYVTDNSGRKIASEQQCERIRKRIMSDLAAFEEADHKEFVS